MQEVGQRMFVMRVGGCDYCAMGQAALTNLEQFGLLGNRKFVISVDQGFALSNPALVSTLSKKSFSNVN